MNTVYDFLISPVENKRYSNVKKIGDKELIINTELSNHQYVNREAIVKATPIAVQTPVKTGDTVLVHHNIFRRWHDVKAKEKNTRSWYNENEYFAQIDQVYLYKRDGEWKALDGYCFVKPIKDRKFLGVEKEERCIGIIKYTDGSFDKEELVGFTPFSTYEFIIDGKRLYRVMNKFITIKYEYQGDEEEYNPSWAESSK